MQAQEMHQGFTLKMIWCRIPECSKFIDDGFDDLKALIGSSSKLRNLRFSMQCHLTTVQAHDDIKFYSFELYFNDFKTFCGERKPRGDECWALSLRNPPAPSGPVVVPRKTMDN